MYPPRETCSPRARRNGWLEVLETVSTPGWPSFEVLEAALDAQDYRLSVVTLSSSSLPSTDTPDPGNDQERTDSSVVEVSYTIRNQEAADLLASDKEETPPTPEKGEKDKPKGAEDSLWWN